MLILAIAIVVAGFIGYIIPQPIWANKVQTWVAKFIHRRG